jgi:hypothetical protein
MLETAAGELVIMATTEEVASATFEEAEVV